MQKILNRVFFYQFSFFCHHFISLGSELHDGTLKGSTYNLFFVQIFFSGFETDVDRAINSTKLQEHSISSNDRPDEVLCGGGRRVIECF